MSDRKPCIRCQRAIDEHAKACPFCNWDQSEPVPPPEPVGAPAHVPPSNNTFQGKFLGRFHGKVPEFFQGRVLGVIAFVALVIIAFVVGTLIHGFEPGDAKAAQMRNTPAPTATVPVTPEHRADVTLVPVSGTQGLAPIEQPITTAPAQAPGEQPNDATALPASEYAAAAARAKAQREADQKQAAILDPRELTGTAYEQQQQRTAAQRETGTQPQEPAAKAKVAENETGTSSAPPPPIEGSPEPARTSAYLQYKPLPHIPVDHDITARLNLTVDPDGHVTDIDVSEPVPDMPKLIAAVQAWRFKPATENGVPVTAHVSVDITFRAND